MNKVMTGLVIGLMMVGSALATETNSMEAIQTLFNSSQKSYCAGKIVEAQVGFEKVLIDCPKEETTLLALSQMYIGYCLFYNSSAGAKAQAQVAFEKVIKNYPTVSIDRFLAIAQLYIGYSLLAQDKQDEAQIAFAKVQKDYPNTLPVTLANSQRHLGLSLQKQGKLVEANRVFMQCVESYIRQLGADTDQSLMWQIFNLIDPKFLTADEYKVFIEKVILVTKAQSNNAAFLGYMKSELEKMK